MSHLDFERIACPGCGAAREYRIFRSLNGERIASQVRRLLDGTFERVRCTACGLPFRLEHRMLYAHYALRTWVVMFSPGDRSHYDGLEHDVERLFAQSFAGAPGLVAAGLRGVRPRLVFGQHALSEAVRVVEASMDPALLECAKLVVFRRSLATLIGHGPVELCYEGRRRGSDDLRMGVYALRTAARVGEVDVASRLVIEIEARKAELEELYPALFTKPYVSATRYLFGTGRATRPDLQ